MNANTQGKHTPARGRYVIANDERGVWEVHKDGCWLVEFESESLAHEFAAAPELLTACQDVFANWQKWDGQITGSHGEKSIREFITSMADTMTGVVAAIARAEGR